MPRTSLGTPTVSTMWKKQTCRIDSNRTWSCLLKTLVPEFPPRDGTTLTRPQVHPKANGGPQTIHHGVSPTTTTVSLCKINQITLTLGASLSLTTMEELSIAMNNMASISLSVVKWTGVMRISIVTCSKIILTWSRTATLTARRAAHSWLLLVRLWLLRTVLSLLTPFSCSLVPGDTDGDSARSFALCSPVSVSLSFLSLSVHFYSPSTMLSALALSRKRTEWTWCGLWLMTSTWLSPSGLSASSPCSSSAAAVSASPTGPTSEEIETSNIQQLLLSSVMTQRSIIFQQPCTDQCLDVFSLPTKKMVEPKTLCTVVLGRCMWIRLCLKRL